VKDLNASNVDTNQTDNTILQLEAIIEASHDAIIGKTFEGIITSWNNGATTILGYAPEEVIGKSLENLFPTEKKDELPKVLEKVKKGEVIADYDSVCIRKDGTRVDMRFYVSPVHGKVGEIIGATVVGRDITDENKTKADYMKSKQFFDEILNTISDPIFVKDNQCRFVLVNDAEVAMTGQKREDQIGKTTLESYPKSEADVFLKNDREVLATGKESVSEEKLTDAKGVTLTIVTKKTLYMDALGNKYVVGIIRDITDRKMTEEKIKIFSDAIACSLDCFLLTDIEGNVTYANESSRVTFGYTLEEFLKLNISSLDADPQNGKKVMQVIKVAGKWSGEVTNIKKNKQIFPSFISVYIIKDKEGNLKGTMGIIRNITEQKKAEEKFKMKYDEMQRLYNATVDRELKMVELKKEIEILKSKR